MNKPIKLTLQIVARSISHNTSSNVGNMERALRSVGLNPKRNGLVFEAKRTCSNRVQAIVARRRIETAIRHNHHNALYRFKFRKV